MLISLNYQLHYCIFSVWQFLDGGKIESKPATNSYNPQPDIEDQPPMPPPSMPPPPFTAPLSAGSNNSYSSNGDKKDRKRKSRWDDW